MYRVKWSRFILMTTFMIAMILISFNIYQIQCITSSKNAIIGLISLTLINSLSLFVICNIPLKIGLNKEALVIKYPFKTTTIHSSDISIATKLNTSAYTPSRSSYNFIGHLGQFSNEKRGWYTLYALNRNQTFLIVTHNGFRQAFSCENSEQLVNEINLKLK